MPFQKGNRLSVGIGRPKGVLSPATIQKIKTKQALEKALAEKAGLLADNLLRASNNLDTRATEIALDRAFGKIPQGINVQAVQFSLKELSEYRKNLQQGDQQGVPELPKPEEVK